MRRFLIISGSKSSTRSLLLSAGLVALMAAAVVTPAMAASNYYPIYSFKGKTDGLEPAGGVVADKNGVLYGATADNEKGAYTGTLYRLTPPQSPSGSWTHNVIYRFNPATDLGRPFFGLAMDQAGALYGTTFGVTGKYRTQQGVVFKATPPVPPSTVWTETPIYKFTSAMVYGGVSVDSAGALYLTNATGGAKGQGEVYQLTPPVAPSTAWTLSTIYTFTGPDGALPASGVMVDSAGNLYGTTLNGGANGKGAVFKLTPPAAPSTSWTETVLFSFTGANGEAPVSRLVFDNAGALYGVAINGGALGKGVAFKLTPPTAPSTSWSQTVVHNFSGKGDGAYPQNGFAIDSKGVLYGSAMSGGSRPGHGVIYTLNPPVAPSTAWTEKVLHNFSGDEHSAGPSGVLLLNGGAVFGTIANFGPGKHGQVFKLTP